MDNISSKTNVPPAAFLGACERINSISRGDPIANQYNILGLGKVIISYIFPLDLNNFKLVFAIFDPLNHGPFKIRLLSPKSKEIMKFDIAVLSVEKGPVTETSNSGLSKPGDCLIMSKENTSWFIFIPEISNINPTVEEPGCYRVVLTKDERDLCIGELIFAYAKAPLFSEPQIAAIRSNPLAYKKVLITIKCNVCQDQIRAYAGLEKDGKEEARGVVWYGDLPETQKCKCGKAEFKFKYIRENLHALLGKVFTNKPEVSFTKLYEIAVLEEISKKLSALLNSEPEEEVLQKFIQENPILLEQFSPKEIFYKAPILTKNKTDIVIRNQKNELLLIELEKTNTLLLKKRRWHSSAISTCY